MSSDDNQQQDTAELLREKNTKISRLGKIVGHDHPHLDDATKAHRWNRSVYEYFSLISDHLHSLSNFAQVMIGLAEQLSSKLDRNASISAENQQLSREIVEAAHNLEESARRIEEGVGIIVPTHPFLMRDVLKQPTELIELGLFACSALEATVFMVSSPALLRSAVFEQMYKLIPSSRIWGIVFLLVSGMTIVAWLQRGRGNRTVAAFLNAILSGTATFMTLWHPDGLALDPMHHLLAFIGSTYVLYKRPSNAP